MKKLFTIVLSSIMLLGVAGCKQSKAEQELARLQDSLNNAKMEQQKLYDDSIQKVQKEQRQQAIADSIAEAKRLEAERIILENAKKVSVGSKLKDVCNVSGVEWYVFGEAGGNYMGAYLAFKYNGRIFYTNAFYSWSMGEEATENITRTGADRLSNDCSMGLKKVAAYTPNCFANGAVVIANKPWSE